MRKLLPKPFGWHERFLALLAVVLAAVSAYTAWKAGFKGMSTVFLSTIVGTGVFVVIGGPNRCFFTALFSILLSGGVTVASLFYHMVVKKEAIQVVDLVIYLLLLVFLIGVPVGFAWLITQVVNTLSGLIDKK